ncbi:MAG: D-alanine--D-alanine ligase [Prevotellaceae bacterium]|jgi:D-alanine-D-alanine ligase|nr:D-alanine--D-alanine ligase [Prevotellaceae bacterium]
MKKNVAVVFGGDSSEAIISERSARNIVDSIPRDRYEVYSVSIIGTDWNLCCEDGSKAPIDRNDFSAKLIDRTIRFDCAFIIIHGTPGENGLLQSYFELIRLPYTTCSAFVSALTFDKYACKRYLRDLGIDMASEVLLKKGDSYEVAELVGRLGLPLFVKPNAGGSSFGVTKVRSADELDSALEHARMEGCDEVLVESFIEGVELSHGICIFNNHILRLPVTEIVSKNDFFDFEAKYTAGRSDEITPARISDELNERVQHLTERICRRLSCRGLARIDYIYSSDRLYFLEINTIPGFSDASIVPQQLRHAGYEVSEVLATLIDDSISRLV